MSTNLPIRTLLLVVLFSTACTLFESDEPPEPVATPADFSVFEADTTALPGSWQWFRTVAYFTTTGTPAVENPESEGITRELIFPGNDSVRVYHNGELQSKQNLHLYLNRPQWGITEDTLVISTAAMDGPERWYVRDD